MKSIVLAAALLASGTAAHAQDVGVSISVGQPGFYGRIDIGDYPRPQVLYAQPVIVQRPVRYVESAPIYLRVPPGHAKHWSKHCRAYNACGQQVYFVQDRWYTNDYAPRYRAQHGHDDRGHGRDERREERREEHGNQGHGHGDGDEHGKGHGKGHNKD
ncbi:hypothetical protein H7U20_26650 [Rugamonas sp. CCM 8940]|nr:hypothetical protein [Rugamonas sp. CCM 8940]